MRSHEGFSDSDLSSFLHETDRRSGNRPVAKPVDDAAQRLLRTAPNPRDKSLTALALAWRDRLPPAQRPQALCDQFPRIANRLALCWDDAALTAKVLQELLEDRRGTRRGYPAEVQRELVVLRSAGR